ncbi:UxaA family hydrolase [Klebsiella pneumoniae]|nr:UxaA family hydrolase [Klebsiella pneumoniae]
MSCGSCRPSAASTRWPNKCRTVSGETYGAEDIDGVHLFSHTYGCSQLGDVTSTLAPCCKIWFVLNAGAVLVVGATRQKQPGRAFRGTLGEFDPQRVHFMVCQPGDEVEAGVEHHHQLYEVMRRDKRQPGKLSELRKFGLGAGSDGLSGITANPMLGRYSRLCDRQRRHYRPLTEVPEMFGAERLLMSHCRDEATFDKLVTMVSDCAGTLLLTTSLFTKTPRRR